MYNRGSENKLTSASKLSKRKVYFIDTFAAHTFKLVFKCSTNPPEQTWAGKYVMF